MPDEPVGEAAPRLARAPSGGGWLARCLPGGRRQRDELLAEIHEIQGLLPLLMKRRNGGHWSRADRRELRRELGALAHVAPYLIVLALPGSFVLLPLLAWWLDRRSQRRH